MVKPLPLVILSRLELLLLYPQNPNARPLFLFGVGAQKAGTTWLSAQLSKNPSVGFGWNKETCLWGSQRDKRLTD